MPLPSSIQASFSKGEISPTLYGRVDAAAYRSALKTGRNATVATSGGVSNRPGTIFINACKDHTYDPVLVRFAFKTSDQYQLEFGNQYIRFLRNDAAVVESAKTITGITQANPGVVTATSHGFANGEDVFIDGIVGMTRLNGRVFRVAGQTTHTFQLTDPVSGANINTTSFTAWASGGTASRLYTLTTPYLTADLERLKFNQSADVMTITHPDYAPRELSRTGHTSWTLSVISFDPDIDFPTAQTVTPNTTGAVTERYQVTAISLETGEESLPATNNVSRTITGITKANPAVVTAASHAFANGDEVYIANVAGMTEVNGRRFVAANVAANTFELAGVDSTNYTTYTSGGTARQTFVQITNGAASQDNIIAWTAVADAGRYAVYRRDNGIYAFIGETELTTFEDDNLNSDLSISPPKARNPFLLEDDYPGVSTYYEQRRAFAGSNNAPDTQYFSRIGAYSNMTVSSPLRADDAITTTLASQEVNEIRHYAPGNDLLVLTSGSEWRVNSGADAAFEAATIKQKPQSRWGCSHLAPRLAGNTVIFVEEDERSIRSFGYSLQLDGYTGVKLNLLANHLFDGYTIVSWNFAHSPDTVGYFIRSDGRALAMAFSQEQEVIAFTHWNTQGWFTRVSTLRHNSTNAEDGVYFIVKRRVNGQTVRYIEKLASRHFTQVEDCFFVDCGLSLDSPIDITGVTAANPVVITAPAHGLSDGDPVDISDIVWDTEYDEFDGESQPDQLNGKRYTVANKTADTFELVDEDGDDIDGSAFEAYVEGGYVRKAVTAISGLDHLEGKAVAVLANGSVVPDLTVANGAIALPEAASRVHVGLAYSTDIETLKLETSQGTIQGKKLNIPHVTVRVVKSRGLWAGPDKDHLREWKQRENENMDAPTTLFTGDVELTIAGKWQKEGSVFLRQRDPLPLSVVAIIPEFDVEN